MSTPNSSHRIPPGFSMPSVIASTRRLEKCTPLSIRNEQSTIEEIQYLQNSSTAETEPLCKTLAFDVGWKQSIVFHEFPGINQRLF
jgi:hypothetical protein